VTLKRSSEMNAGRNGEMNAEFVEKEEERNAEEGN